MGFTLEGSLSFREDISATGDADYLLLHGQDISEGVLHSDENIPNSSVEPHGLTRKAMLVSMGNEPFSLISSSMLLVKQHMREQSDSQPSRDKDDSTDKEVNINKIKINKKMEKPFTGSFPSSILKRTVGMKKKRNRGLGPSFTDYFGWCTWDSFYTDLSSNRVLSGLQSFKSTGVVPRFLILDDGWQVGEMSLCSAGIEYCVFCVWWVKRETT